jgi:uncharacterized protein
MPTGLEWALLGTVVSASVLGSLHCAFMCGPLVSACQGGDARRVGPDVGYHLARGLGYVTLGALSGALGSVVDWAFAGVGIARAGAVVSGLLVALAGLLSLWPSWRTGAAGGGSGLLASRALGAGLVRLRRKGPTLRGALLGLLTPILPCGYLYAFVLSAAGTGSSLGGALLMAAFWLGTLPALLGVGYLVRRLSHAARARLPLVTGLTLIALGVLGVLGRGLSPVAAAERSPKAALEGLSRGEGHEHAACH